MLSTRRCKSINLVGVEKDDISGVDLPNKKQVLQYFFYQRRTLKRSVRESARCAVRKCSEIWRNAKLQMDQEINSIAKIERLYNEWKNLGKSKNFKSCVQEVREFKFQEKLKSLFDISKNGACQNLSSLQFQLRHSDSDILQNLSNYDLTDLVEDTVEMTDLEEEAFQMKSIDSNCSSSKKVSPLSKEVCLALDRSKLSDRKATHILATTCNGDIKANSNIVLSRQTVRRFRQKVRKQLSEEIKNNAKTTSKLVVQWDGKLLPDLLNKNNKVDRLPVIVVGENVTQLLGVPKLARGTGELQANAVISLLEEWGLSDQVAGMCFDTTSTNSGLKNGSCTLLEKKLKRKLLHLACRHHIAEVLLRTAFESCLGNTSKPEVTIFNQFKKLWTHVNHTNYESCMIDPEIPQELKDNKDSLLYFYMEILQVEKTPRDDYKELLELIIIFLGGVPIKGISFKKPGATHHARWMAKGLYSLKMYLFRKELKESVETTNALRDISIFIAVLYAKYWFTASKTEKAPFNDLKLLQGLSNCIVVKQEIREAVLKKFRNHLWYFNEELIALSFFDAQISTEVKKKMVLALQTKSKNKILLRRINLRKLSFKEINNLSLEYFVTSNTLNFFKILDIPTDFLNVDPSNWRDRTDYKKAMQVIKCLPVINDNAERAVALTTEFNHLITNSETEKQYLLQAVCYERRMKPNCNKKTLGLK